MFFLWRGWDRVVLVTCRGITVSSFDVRVFAIRRRPGRKTFEVRWRVAGRDRSRSFMTRALADGYRAELVRAARRGVAFAPQTGEPESWAAAEPVTVTWYRHAVAYAEMKWPRLAPHSRASLADALAAVTPLLTGETGRRPPPGRLRAALYGRAFNPQQQRSCAPDPGTADALAWLERASLPVSRLSDPGIIRAALDGLCTRLDGSPAAANTIARKRALFHSALGHAVELGLLPANPLDLVRWRVPRAAVAVRPAAVASPAQVRAILAEVSRVRPELAAFFGCLYYAALRPEEAVALRRDDLILPAHGSGKMVLTTACPRTGTAWTSTGTPFEPRGLKHRPGGTIRIVPIPAVGAGMLRQHLQAFGTAPDGRLFRGARGGMLSESVYGRAWHAARQAALGPGPAATALARRPYDLRHAALSLWLNATGAPAEVAARAGTSARVLHDVYIHCVSGQDDTVSQQIEDALNPGAGVPRSSRCGKASGYTNRRLHPRPCPPYVREPVSRPAHSPRSPGSAGPQHCTQASAAASVSAAQAASSETSTEARRCPDPAHA
jgi:integrase